MITFAKLIHKTYMSYLPTAYSAQYYGMPNGKIYLVYSRFYELGIGETGLEFVFAEHKEFLYDYDNETIISTEKISSNLPVFEESIDKPNPKIQIFKIKRNLNSYREAQILLDKEAKKMKKYA